MKHLTSNQNSMQNISGVGPNVSHIMTPEGDKSGSQVNNSVSKSHVYKNALKRVESLKLDMRDKST